MCDVGWDSDGPAFFSRTERKARKQHACDACDGKIQPGERYVVESFVAARGERAESQKCCMPCDQIIEEFMLAHDSGPFPAYARSALKQCIDEEPETAPKWQPMLDEMDARRKAAA
jgi:hypothetical protein